MDQEIVLEVDGIQFQCIKSVLRASSPYFDAMFSGNFKEQEENVVVIKDVSPIAMKLIINSLSEKSLHIEDEDLLPTLQASCMLQFDRIKAYCITTITEILSHEFCINVYFMAIQLDLQPLAKKSLCIALLHFKHVVETNAFINLNIHQVHHYLSHPALHVDNEIDVFEAGMKWWYEHENLTNKCSQSENDEYCNQILLCILNCLSFKSISLIDLKLMLTYPGISNHKWIATILNGLCSLKETGQFEGDDGVRRIVIDLIEEDLREIPHLPCIVGVKKPNLVSVPGNTLKVEIKNAKSYIMFYDGSSQLLPLVPLRHVGNEDGHSLEGYRIQVWKNKIILFGGEYMYGHGNWNTSCWLFDTTKEKWSKLTQLPSVRRHFKCCIVNDKLFVVAGTGQYRVVQYNMDCYDLKKDMWIKKIKFPSEFRDVECCEFNGNLLLTCGGNHLSERIEMFLYNVERNKWTQLALCDPQKLYKQREHLEHRQSLRRRSYVPFVYKGNLFINGNYLLGLKYNQETLQLQVFYFGSGMSPYDGTLLPVGMCVVGDNVYTFKSEDCADVDNVTYNSTLQLFSLIDKTSEQVDLINKDVMLTQDSGCFGLFHHSLL